MMGRCKTLAKHSAFSPLLLSLSSKTSWGNILVILLSLTTTHLCYWVDVLPKLPLRCWRTFDMIDIRAPPEHSVIQPEHVLLWQIFHKLTNIDWRQAGGGVALSFVSLALVAGRGIALSWKANYGPRWPTQHTRATMHIFSLAIITLLVAPAAPSFFEPASAPRCDGHCNHQCSEVSITAYTCQENCICSSETTGGLICTETGTCDSEETTAVCEAKMTGKTPE